MIKLMGLLTGGPMGLAMMILPIIGKAFDMDKADDWIYMALPGKLKKNGTLKEFENVIKTGRQFYKACKAFVS